MMHRYEIDVQDHYDQEIVIEAETLEQALDLGERETQEGKWPAEGITLTITATNLDDEDDAGCREVEILPAEQRTMGSSY